MKGFDFQQLVGRVAGFTASLIEGPTCAGGRTSIGFTQVHDRAVQLAARLRDAGLQPGEVLAIRSANCIEWVIWDLACVINGHVLHVFLEDLAGPDSNEVHARYGYRLFADARAAAGTSASGVCNPLDRGALRLAPGEPVFADDPDVFSLVYSSGSSGEPKGLQISRRGTEYLIDQFLDAYTLQATDRSLMFMPLSNFQQRMSMYAFLWTGTSFSLTDLENAFPAARDFAPSYMVAPPSFYEQALQRFPGPPGAADSLKNGLGGALRFVHVGMAPATGDPIGRFRAQGIAMFEAYGVTEAGMVAWSTPKASRAGSVGKPVNPEEVFVDDSGEVIVRRQYPLCLGYFEASQEDQDGTFRSGEIATGDLGEFDEDGFLYLRGRSKNRIVLPSGARMQPEIVEQAIRQVAPFCCCLAFFEPSQGVLQCYLVPERGSLAEVPVLEVRKAILTAVGEPLEVEVVTSTVLPSLQAGTLTRNLKIRRGPMALWIQARLADQDPRLQRHVFPAQRKGLSPFIEHLPTLQRIEGYSYLVVRIDDHPVACTFASLQQIVRERLGKLGKSAVEDALLPTSFHLTLAEWHGHADLDALAQVVSQWASAQSALSLGFESLHVLPEPSCLLLASANADLSLRKALSDLRALARRAGIACVEQVLVEDWLFHVSLAHCPGGSATQWHTLTDELPMPLSQFESLRVTQVELVHYCGYREFAQAVPLLGPPEEAS